MESKMPPLNLPAPGTHFGLHTQAMHQWLTQCPEAGPFALSEHIPVSHLVERSSPLRETFPSISLVIIKHLICSNMYSFVKHKLCVTQLL